MKKISVLFILFSLSAASTYAQTWDEWFAQKKTQLKYLTQQIAALQVYEGYLNKGYQIAKGGLQTIRSIKKGEFNLHQTFFSSLSHVSPAVHRYTRIADIIALQLAISKQYQQCRKQVRQAKELNENETQYISSVFTALLNNCANDIADLISATTNGGLQLSDDERLHRIDAIYEDLREENRFVQSFSKQTNRLMLNRQKEQNEASSLSTLYNLK